LGRFICLKSWGFKPFPLTYKLGLSVTKLGWACQRSAFTVRGHHIPSKVVGKLPSYGLNLAWELLLARAGLTNRKLAALSFRPVVP
jgi:hypothetical protein